MKPTFNVSVTFSFLLLVLAFLSGCASKIKPVDHTGTATIPPLFFEQTIKEEKTPLSQSKSNEALQFIECGTVTKDRIIGQSQKITRRDFLSDTTKPEVNTPKAPKTQTQNEQINGRLGKGTAKFGLFINVITLLLGIALAAVFGFGWGPVVGLFWVLFLLLSIPLMLIGLITSLSGYIKMKHKNAPRSFLRISLYSLIAFLGSILIWIIQLSSN